MLSITGISLQPTQSDHYPCHLTPGVAHGGPGAGAPSLSERSQAAQSHDQSPARQGEINWTIPPSSKPIHRGRLLITVAVLQAVDQFCDMNYILQIIVNE